MSRENQAVPFWTSRIEVSPSGQGAAPVAPQSVDPLTLLQFMLNFQNQTNDLLRQSLELQKQSIELLKESVHVGREQRARQAAELEKWQNSHEGFLETSKITLSQLEKVHSALMQELASYVEDNYENLLDADFSLSDFVDRFGPRLAHLNTMLAVLRPLAASLKKQEQTQPT